MAQKIRKINFRSVKRRVVGNKEVQRGGEDEQCQVAKFRRLRNFAGCEISQAAKFCWLRNFAGCEILQPANFRRLRNFHNLRNPQAQFAPPKLNTCNKTK